MLERLTRRNVRPGWRRVLSTAATVSLLAACGGESRGQTILDDVTAPDGYSIVGREEVATGGNAVILQPVDGDTPLPRDLSTLDLLPKEYVLGEPERETGCDIEWTGADSSGARVCADWFDDGAFRGESASTIRSLTVHGEQYLLVAQVGDAARIGAYLDGADNDDSPWILAISVFRPMTPIRRR